MEGRELYHHGVLGMRWGVRRYQPYSTNPRRSGKGGEEIGEAAQRKQERRIKRANKATSRKERKLTRKQRRYERANYKYIKARPGVKYKRGAQLSRKLVKVNRAKYQLNKKQSKRDAIIADFISEYGKKTYSSLDMSYMSKPNARAQRILNRNSKLQMKYLRRGVDVTNLEGVVIEGTKQPPSR